MINTPLSEMNEHDERDLVVFAMVARPVTKAERLVNAKAMASLDKEWNKLENQRVWIVEKGRSWREVAEEARTKGEVAHVGRIFDHVVNGVSGASCCHGLVNWGGHLLQTCAYLHLVLFQLALCQCRMGFFSRGFFTSPSPPRGGDYEQFWN